MFSSKGMSNSCNNNISAESNSSPKIEYEIFDDLKEIDINTNLNNIYSDIEQEQDWVIQFQAINLLRQLNKFDFKTFALIFSKVIFYVKKLSASLRSNISKITLMLLTEIVNYNPEHKNEINNWLPTMIASAAAQSSSNKHFIKEEVIKFYSAISDNIFTYTCLALLLTEIKSKVLPASENSFNSAMKLIENWEWENFYSLKEWNNIFLAIINLYNLKREPYNKRSVKIYSLILDKLGKDSLDKKIKSCGNDGNLRMLDQIENDIANLTKSKSNGFGSLKEFKKKL